ncbi:MAG: LD-carboxypeptidase family protein [Bacillales bacterium]|jgi:muramoyltetrapeptide carboxypeptidase LdcA involved in peptidoglycan recycling|nr:LD-carboxypeptidase family protein [Bacillales bacterium]
MSHNLNLIKPPMLKPGDKVAAVSLSWGGAGDEEFRWRYEVGKMRLKELFGLEVVEMPHTLSGSQYVYDHPQKRAEDLMSAFLDPSIKGVFSCIGGYESIRMLPYIDFDVIKNNPKVFIGFSDSTTTHYICLKAGVSSFYGASILAEFAENIKVFDYTVEWVQKTLFENKPLGIIPAVEAWTGERIEWLEKNKHIEKKLKPNQGYDFLQGNGKVQGRLIGGCMEVLEMLKGTILWPELDTFKEGILFLETSEDKPDPTYVGYWLRNYGSQGILQNIKAIIWGKPKEEKYYDEYKEVIHNVIVHELGLKELPIVYNMSFGHNEPMCCLPFGALAEIDCDNKTFSIIESGVV